MNLGQQIYKLRTAKNLSQGDLADALDVSRQSISKWENNATTPELEKLVKMSQLFDVSLDTLVHGTDANAQDSHTPAQAPAQDIKKPSKTSGTVLLGIGGALAIVLLLLGGDFLSIYFFTAPFLFCGIILLSAQSHRLLLCLWAIYCSIYQYLQFGTGITFSIVLLTPQFQPEWNYTRLAIGWILLVLYLILIVVSLWSGRNESRCPTKANCRSAIALWLTVPLLYGCNRGLFLLIARYGIDWNYGPRALMAVLTTATFATLAWALVHSVSLLHGARKTNV